MSVSQSLCLFIAFSLDLSLYTHSSTSFVTCSKMDALLQDRGWRCSRHSPLDTVGIMVPLHASVGTGCKQWQATVCRCKQWQAMASNGMQRYCMHPSGQVHCQDFQRHGNKRDSNSQHVDSQHLHSQHLHVRIANICIVCRHPNTMHPHPPKRQF